MTSTAWRPSRPAAYLIAVLSIWPIVYFMLFLAFVAFSFATITVTPSGRPPVAFIRYIFPLHFLTILLMFALTAVYVVHVFKSDQLPSDRRIMWVIVLLFGNIVAFPIYWWIYMRPGAPAAARPGEASPAA
jgi:hypothetical protein